MRQKYWTRLSRVFLVFAVVGIASFLPTVVSATCVASQQSCTTKYGVSQTQFSSGSNYNQCSTGSTGYCANASVGDLGDGGGVGPNGGYQSQSGPGLVTNRAASLAFTVSGVSTNLGTLGPGITTTLANFSVKTYQAGSYIVQVSAQPPMDNAPSHHLLAVPSTPSAPAAGTEMFAMNLTQNSTNPGGGTVPFGAFPTCSPDPTFCPSGALTSSITANYHTDGKYFYPGSGSNYTDTIINSNTSTGQVSYTLSIVYVISDTTPDGAYTYNGMFVATPTY